MGKIQYKHVIKDSYISTTSSSRVYSAHVDIFPIFPSTPLSPHFTIYAVTTYGNEKFDFECSPGGTSGSISGAGGGRLRNFPPSGVAAFSPAAGSQLGVLQATQPAALSGSCPPGGAAGFERERLTHV